MRDGLVEVPENAMAEERIALGLTAPQLAIVTGAVLLAAALNLAPLWPPLKVLLIVLLPGPVALAAVLSIRGEPAYRWLLRASRYWRSSKIWHAEVIRTVPEGGKQLVSGGVVDHGDDLAGEEAAVRHGTTIESAEVGLVESGADNASAATRMLAAPSAPPPAAHRSSMPEESRPMDGTPVRLRLIEPGESGPGPDDDHPREEPARPPSVPFVLPGPRLVCFLSFVGGVGKTTLAVEAATYIASRARYRTADGETLPVRALLIDAARISAAVDGWRVTGKIGGRPRPVVAEPEAVAELWSPPTRGDESRAVEILHSRLPAPAVLRSGERPIGRHGDQTVSLPAEVFLRHAAFIGGTGSGKSTQLVALAADDLAAGRGFTFLDPHGDAVERLLDAVPDGHVERVHLIRLAEREAPRGFNFLELDGADAELVAVQFVDTLYDLYAKYSGPKQTHYLRMALLTLLAREPEADGPWTVVDLYQLLVNRDVRRRFTADLADEVLRDFWQHEWPLDSPRAREQSVEAVLNKLGGFIAYPTIRDIVGARHSTIRPRAVMDAGEVLLVDLSRVGRDHARLFGSMLIGRYYIDAMARQGTTTGTRTPHQLYVDEVHNFDTSSLRGILTETRKFHLGLTLATQYVRRLQPELAEALRSNVATIGLLQPSPADVADVADLFEPLTRRDLLNLPRFRMALRSEVDGERLVITPDVLPVPASLGSTGSVRRVSDARDGRWRA